MGDAFNKDIYVRYSIAHGNVTWTKGVINIRNNFSSSCLTPHFSTLSDVSKVDSFKRRQWSIKGRSRFKWSMARYISNQPWYRNRTKHKYGWDFQSFWIDDAFDHPPGKRMEMSTFSKIANRHQGNNGADAAFGNDVMRSKNSIAKINGEVVLQLQNGFVPGAGIGFRSSDPTLGYTRQFTSVSRTLHLVLAGN